MKKAFSIFSISFLTLTLLTACNRSENETRKELNALKEQLAQQQKLQAERENQELEHRKQIEQRQRENEIYEQAYQSAQEDLKMQQMLEEEQRQEEAKQKRAQDEQKQDEAKKRLAIEEERKQEETKKAEEKKTAAPKPTEKLTRYPAFVITASGSGTINLRGGPSTSNIAVKQLRDGQELQVIAETNKCEDAGGGCWVKVQVGDLKGYVSNAYLQRGTAYVDTGY